MSKVAEFFGFKQPKQPAVEIPKVETPAVPAPSRREDTGANIVVGSDAAKDKRVSGRGSGSGTSSSGGSALGNLGRSGISI